MDNFELLNRFYVFCVLFSLLFILIESYTPLNFFGIKTLQNIAIYSVLIIFFNIVSISIISAIFKTHDPFDQKEHLKKARLVILSEKTNDSYETKNFISELQYERSKKLAMKQGGVNTEDIQRDLNIGYEAAKKIIEGLENEKIIAEGLGHERRVIL